MLSRWVKNVATTKEIGNIFPNRGSLSKRTKLLSVKISVGTRNKKSPVAYI
jgi:hypothetical protein